MQLLGTIKGIVKLLALAVVVLLPPLYLQSLSAQNVIDPADILRVNSPAANSTVRGSVEIKFVAFDNDQVVVPVRIQILDGNCSASRGTLLDASFPSSQSERVVGWNTVKAYLDAGPVGDGNACVSVCSEYKYGQTDYNACNRRVVRVRNVTNQNPVIRSRPITSVTEGQGYSYSVDATDADGDALTYVLVQKPGFLSMQGNRVFSSAAAPAGSYQVTVEVRDTFGGSTRQSYTLVVNPLVAPPTPAPTPPGQVEFGIVSPLDDTTFTVGSAKIQWSLPNSAGVAALNIDYANAGRENWTLITRITDKAAIEAGQYDWDISGVAPGEYRLRYRIEFEGGQSAQENVSPVFNIDNQSTPPVVESDRVSISSLRPAAGLSVVDLSPTLGARISVKDLDLKLENIQFKLDGSDVSGCELTNIATAVWSLECPSTNLAAGSHELVLNVLDEDGELIADGGSRTWSFTIVDRQTDGGDPSEQSEQNVFGIIAVILGLLLCLLLLPLLLLGVWRNRTRSYTTTTSKTTTTVSPTRSDSNLTTSITGDTFKDYAISTQVDPYDPFSSVNTNVESSYIAPVQAQTQMPEAIKVVPTQPVAASEAVESTSPLAEASPLAPTNPLDWSTANSSNNLVTNIPENPSVIEPLDLQKTTTVSNAVTQQTNSQPSTADILSGAGAMPVMPPAETTTSADITVASTGNNETGDTSTTTTTSTTTASTVTSSGSDDDLPDWLKDDPAQSSQVALSASNTNKLEEEIDDGSDPYGLGDQSL